MFADACQNVSGFIRPVVISTRRFDGSVSSECGTFIILNRDGWIMTAGHVFDSFVRFQEDQNKIKEINELNASRPQAPGAPDTSIKMDPAFITNHSFWWGWDGVRLNNVYVNRQVDMAVGRLEPFDPSWVERYPVLLDPANTRPGTSLCRMGFPFINIQSSFDEKSNLFRMVRIPLHDTMFPNDGIHTRTINRGKSREGNYDMIYLETSSPGLKGQSGGPIFDKDGVIHAMQVQTSHLPLGFRPMVEYEGKNVVENQFLNVGVGVHVRTIRQILDSRGIKYRAEGDESGFRIID